MLPETFSSSSSSVCADSHNLFNSLSERRTLSSISQRTETKIINRFNEKQGKQLSANYVFISQSGKSS